MARKIIHSGTVTVRIGTLAGEYLKNQKPKPKGYAARGRTAGYTYELKHEEIVPFIDILAVAMADEADKHGDSSPQVEAIETSVKRLYAALES